MLDDQLFPSSEEDINRYRNGANRGESEAMVDLGICLGYGYGVPKDEERALNLWNEAAQKGYYRANYCCGVFYLTKARSSKHENIRTEYYQKATDSLEILNRIASQSKEDALEYTESLSLMLNEFEQLADNQRLTYEKPAQTFLPSIENASNAPLLEETVYELKNQLKNQIENQIDCAILHISLGLNPADNAQLKEDEENLNVTTENIKEYEGRTQAFVREFACNHIMSLDPATYEQKNLEEDFRELYQNKVLTTKFSSLKNFLESQQYDQKTYTIICGIWKFFGGNSAPLNLYDQIFSLAERHAKGKNGSHDKERACILFRVAAELGSPKALLYFHEKEAVENNPKRTFQHNIKTSDPAATELMIKLIPVLKIIQAKLERKSKDANEQEVEQEIDSILSIFVTQSLEKLLNFIGADEEIKKLLLVKMELIIKIQELIDVEIEALITDKLKPQLKKIKSSFISDLIRVIFGA